MEVARERGVDVSCDVYPYAASMTTITALLPSEKLAGGIAKLLERLADSEDRAEMAIDIAQTRMVNMVNFGWDKIMIAECAIAPRYEGQFLNEIITERNVVMVLFRDYLENT